MATEVLARDAAPGAATRHRLLLVWQDPATRRFCRVGQLDELDDNRFAFRYVESAFDESFRPIAQFPDLQAVYVSTALPAFFVNRVMSRRRASYQDYRHWLGLEREGADTPFEVLIRSGGSRATDTFHVVEDLQQGADGILRSRFLASGVRHVVGADERLARLRDGDRLIMRDEPDNKENARAILLNAANGAAVGYVPDWLVNDVHKLRAVAADVEIVAERVNLDAPAHLRLLCRLSARLDVASCSSGARTRQSH